MHSANKGQKIILLRSVIQISEMGSFMLVMMYILVIMRAHTSEAQSIIKEERVPSSCRSEGDQELFQSKIEEIFRELYLPQFMVLETKVMKMLEKQEQNIQKLKEQVADNQGNWQQQLSDLISRMSYIEKNMAEQKSNISNVPNPDFKILEMKLLQVEKHTQNISMNMQNTESTQRNILSEQGIHNIRISDLEGNQKSILQDVFKLKTNLTYLSDAILLPIEKTRGNDSASDTLERDINEVNGSLSLVKAKMSSMERMINDTTSVINVRLVNGSTWSEGRVEVFYNGEWGTVCDDIWTDNNAQVICRHLGYSSGVPFGEATFGKGEGRIWMDDVVCNGSESNIFDCQYPSIGTHNCVHGEDAGIACMKSFAMRLMVGNLLSRYEGRVEILINGKWGTVCDDLWDNNDAKVVCRYLGYTGTAVAYTSAAYGQGDINFPIYLDDVACTGSESFILDCEHKGVEEENCGHTEDAGVKCSGG